MHQVFINFQKQFTYNPTIANRQKYAVAKKFIILGMGGSHLAADLIKNYNPQIDLLIHKNYGLPKLADKELKQSLIIANSYSGNTEEVLDGLKIAIKKKLNIIVIATGGKLISLAKKNNLPYIQMPNWGIQPRCALGLNCRAILKALGQNQAYAEIGTLAKTLKGRNYKSRGKTIAKMLKNKIPVIYSSENNYTIAYNWKIKFNENSKIPAFCNTLPELNHNEMTGFDISPESKKLSQNFFFIFISDDTDHKQIQKRMLVTAKLYKKRNLPVTILSLAGKNKWQKIFSNLLIADWASYYNAKNYNHNPEQVPMVEEFKKMI